MAGCTDVAWHSHDNVCVTDGYGNSHLVHEIGCKEPNVVYLGSAIPWNVTKVTITPK